jgi:DNA-directed RNA polymerase specialized sigma24 family protein
MTLEKKLEMWIEAYCCDVRPITRKRFKEMNDIFYTIYNDRRFQKYQNAKNFGDALSNMWLYFFNNLCEVTTARTSGSFLDTRDYAVGRLLTNFKGHLQNIESQMWKDMIRQEQPRINEDGNLKDPINDLPNPEPNLAVRQFEEFLNLLEKDPMGELQDPVNTLRGIKKSYELTAQTYLLMRYRDDKTIQQIADQLDIPRGTLQGSAKPTRWKALAHKYAEMAMNNLGQE